MTKAERDARDLARYRHLRDATWGEFRVRDGREILIGPALDRRIDRDMRETKKRITEAMRRDPTLLPKHRAGFVRNAKTSRASGRVASARRRAVP